MQKKVQLNLFADATLTGISAGRNLGTFSLLLIGLVCLELLGTQRLKSISVLIREY